MYTRIHIKNFRGLRDVAIDDLARVNLFVGPNGIGKTSLLEALWLSEGPSNPALSRNIANLRGFNPVPSTSQDLWHSLFHNLSPENPIEVENVGIDGTKSMLRISLSRPSVTRVSSETEDTQGEAPMHSAATSEIPVETLQYEYSVGDEEPVITSAVLFPGGMGMQIHGESRVTKPTTIILSARRETNPEELGERFTKVYESGGMEKVSASLQHFVPELRSLYLGFVERRPQIRGLMEMGEKLTPVPLPLVGGGGIRLVEILLAALNARSGLVLIDEIENGLYYKNLEAAWKAIELASASADVQVFATTHSWECIQAAVAAFTGEHAGDFRLHRLERKKGEVRAFTYTHELAQTALDVNLEVR